MAIWPVPLQESLSAQSFVDGFVKDRPGLIENTGKGIGGLGHKGVRFLFGFRAAFSGGLCAGAE